MPFSRWRLGSLLTWSPSRRCCLSRPYVQGRSRVWVRPTVSFANRLAAPEIRLVWLPRGWLSVQGPHLCDLDQDLDYLCFFLFYAPRPHLQDRSLNPPKKTWIFGTILSSDLVYPDLLPCLDTPQTLSSQLPRTIASKRHSLPTFDPPQTTSRQCESDAILNGVSPIPGRLASSLLLAVLGFCRVTSPHTTSCRH